MALILNNCIVGVNITASIEQLRQDIQQPNATVVVALSESLLSKFIYFKNEIKDENYLIHSKALDRTEGRESFTYTCTIKDGEKDYVTLTILPRTLATLGSCDCTVAHWKTEIKGDQFSKQLCKFLSAVVHFNTAHEAVPHVGFMYVFNYCPHCGQENKYDAYVGCLQEAMQFSKGELSTEDMFGKIIDICDAKGVFHAVL